MKKTLQSLLLAGSIALASIFGTTALNCKDPPTSTTTTSSTSTSTSTSEPTETASGHVYEFGSTKPLDGITVDIGSGSYQTTTDSNGFWEIQDIPHDDHTISFSSSNYTTYNSKIKINDIDNLESTLKLFPESHSEYFENTIRKDDLTSHPKEGKITPWDLVNNWPKFRIYTLEHVSENPVPSEKTDIDRAAITTYLSQFGHTQFIDNEDIELVNEKLPGLPSKGYVYIHYNEGQSSDGGNDCGFEGDNVAWGYVAFKLSADLPVKIQELAEVMVGGSSEINSMNIPEKHEDYLDSCFHEPPSATFFSKQDLICSDILYGQYPRKAGNFSKDNDPSDSFIN